MMPTLNDDERIFINQFTYRFGISDISRGDTIVFWYPWDRSKSYIKRVIGIPGDLVSMEDGQGLHQPPPPLRTLPARRVPGSIFHGAERSGARRILCPWRPSRVIER